MIDPDDPRTPWEVIRAEPWRAAGDFLAGALLAVSLVVILFLF